MKTTPCRDCGYQVETGARGCSQCALNLEAEKMIDRVIWLRIVPGLIMVIIVTAGLVYYLLR